MKLFLKLFLEELLVARYVLVFWFMAWFMAIAFYMLPGNDLSFIKILFIVFAFIAAAFFMRLLWVMFLRWEQVQNKAQVGPTDASAEVESAPAAAEKPTRNKSDQAPASPRATKRAGKSLMDIRTLDDINDLRWQQFEELVGAIYSKQGFKIIKSNSGSHAKPDGGVDICAEKGGNTYIIQCKHWGTKSVGVSHIREMYGVMHSEKADKTIILTSGGFTREAARFKAKNDGGIGLVNGMELLRLVRKHNKSYDAGAEKEIARYKCPKCADWGIQLVKRVSERKDKKGSVFYGCSAYPLCRYIKEI